MNQKGLISNRKQVKSRKLITNVLPIRNYKQQAKKNMRKSILRKLLLARINTNHYKLDKITYL
jgi:hypothetical protein